MLQSMAATTAAAAEELQENFATSKRRRVKDKPLDPRWIVHQQEFAYYQVLPYGVNLIRSPTTSHDLVSGVCLIFAERKEYDAAQGTVVYSVQQAATTPLTSADHEVVVHFRS